MTPAYIERRLEALEVEIEEARADVLEAIRDRDVTDATWASVNEQLLKLAGWHLALEGEHRV